MANADNRTLLIFSVVLVMVLAIAIIAIIAGISIISPVIGDRLSDLPIMQEDIGGNFSGRQLAYICSPVDNTVRAVDPSTKRVVATMNFAEKPVLAIPCPDSGNLYVIVGNGLCIVDGNDLSTMVNITYQYPVKRIAFSPDGRRAYIEIGDEYNSWFLVTNTGTKESLTESSTFEGTGRDGVQVSPDGKYLYLADNDFGSLVVINLHDLTVAKKIFCSLGGKASDVAVSPDGGNVYVSFASSNDLSIINTKNLTLEKNIHMPIANSRSVAASPDGRYVYATNYDDKKRISTVAVISTVNDAVIKEIAISQDPLSMRISPDGNYLYVCTAYDPVQVINTETLSVKSLGFVGSHVEFSK